MPSPPTYSLWVAAAKVAVIVVVVSPKVGVVAVREPVD